MLALLAALSAATPVTLSHQARVLEASGAAVAGDHAVTVELWRSATASDPLTGRLHVESFSPVSIEDGYFSVELGTGSALDSSVFASPEVWIETRVDGALLGPRARLTSAPLAAHAAQTSRFAPSTAACDGTNAADLGLVRWTGTRFEGCTSDGWITFGNLVPGRTASDPAQGCAQVRLDFPQAADGTYWIDPDGSGSPFQAYCDMANGGWTLVARMTVASNQAHYNTGSVGLSLATDPVALDHPTTQKFSDTRINLIRTNSPYTGSTGYRMSCWEGTANVQTMYCSRSCTFHAQNSVNTSECSRCTNTFNGTLIQLTPNTGTRGLGHHHDATYAWTMAWQRHPEQGDQSGCRSDAKGGGNGHLWIR